MEIADWSTDLSESPEQSKNGDGVVLERLRFRGLDGGVVRRGLIGGGVLAALWLAFGWTPYLLGLAGGRLAAIGRLIPSPAFGSVFGSTPGWAVLAQVLAIIAMVAGFASLLGRMKHPSFAGAWLAAIMTGLALGAVLDIGSFVVWLDDFGIQGAAGAMNAAVPTTFWAVVVGWIPALVAVRGAQRTDPPVRTGVKLVLSTLALLALVALPIVDEMGHQALQEQLREEAAEEAAQADPEGAAYPDPNAPGEPVPTVIPAEEPAPPGACDPGNSTILAPQPDAFTGHRLQTIELLNTSAAPCTVEGYPDVAYGDQNSHLLDVTIEHGSPFGAQDPGPSLITLEPYESAVAMIGWSADSVHGQLAARELWLAARHGDERLTWPVSFDLIPGSTVHVTAWHEPAQ